MSPKIKSAQSIIDIIDDFELQNCYDYISEFGSDDGSLYIDVFRDLFNPDNDFAHNIGIAAHLYYQSLLIVDKIIDDKSTILNNEALLLSYILREKSLAIMYKYFPYGHDIWKHFDKYYKEYINALNCEAEKNRNISDSFSFEDAQRIYTGNASIAKVAIVACCFHCNKTEYIVKLEESIDSFNFGKNLYDDINDWKYDFNNNQFSYLIKRVIANYGLQNKYEEISEKELGKYIFLSGILDQHLSLALDLFQKSLSSIKDLNCEVWKKHIKKNINLCFSLKQDLEKLVQKQYLIADIVEVNNSINIILPQSKNLIQEIAATALKYILKEAGKDFIEASNNQYFKSLNGFVFKENYHVSDIFQRAIISDILIDANKIFSNCCVSILSREIEYLIKSRISDVEGWNFYPTLNLQPSDFDTTAQVLQVLTKSGNIELANYYASGPINFLLNHRSNNDGSFGTWLIPSKIENCSELHLKQISFFKDYCKIDIIDQKDTEVIANMLYALYLIDYAKYSELISKGIEYIISKQEKEGFWKSSWYYGPLYGTYLCTRLISIINPADNSLHKVHNYLYKYQNNDGGWGQHTNDSDALNTAFGLITLNYLNKTNRVNGSIVENAFNYLLNAKTEDNYWPQCDFINLLKNVNSRFRSRVLTSSYVLKAAIMWC